VCETLVSVCVKAGTPVCHSKLIMEFVAKLHLHIDVVNYVVEILRRFSHEFRTQQFNGFGDLKIGQCQIGSGDFAEILIPLPLENLQ
jgi:hypothetical protein